jgi:hypothetical protein
VVGGVLAALLAVPGAATAADSVTITSPADGSVVVLSGEPDNPAIAAGSVDVTFDASGTLVTCSLDGQPAVGCTSPASYPQLAAGAHSVTVTAGDASQTVHFTVSTVLLDPAPRLPQARGLLHSRWHTVAARTTNRRLRLTHLQRHVRVTINCRGRGCGARRLYSRTVTGHASLTGALRGRVLRPGARVAVRIAKPGTRPKVFAFTMRRGAAPTSAVY